MTLEHVEREKGTVVPQRANCKVPLLPLALIVQKGASSWSRLGRLSKECKHEQHGRRVYVISGKSHATLPLRSKSAAAKPRRSSGTDPT